MIEARTIIVRGARIEVAEVAGSEPPIVLLHEGLGSVTMWRDFPRQLAKATGRRIVHWSRRSYGTSDPLLEPRTADYMHEEASLVLDALDILQIKEAFLLGHSDGASIALIAAAKAPSRILGLILEAPHVYVEELTVASIAQIRNAYLSGDLKSKLQRYHGDPDNAFWRWNDIWLSPPFLHWNIEGLLPSVKSPTLLVQGRDDEYGSLDQLDRIERHVRIIARIELDHCGHSPHRDQPSKVLAAITAFLEKVNSSAAVSVNVAKD